MKYLVVGSGGREHAIAWRLLNDGSATEVFVAPGNGGIEKKYRIDLKIDDFDGITNFCKKENIDIVVVGPEIPLSEGLIDHLENNNIKAFGPSKKAAEIEGSKLFAKEIMEKYNIPTAKHWDFTNKDELLNHVETIKNYPIVIKLDGLAAGKGVGIPENKTEAIKFINENVQQNSKVFVEEFLKGEEASVFGISDGKNVLTFIAAQDHKRIFDGDKGPNTGGMGAYAPAPVVTEKMLDRITNEVLQPTIDGMAKEGVPYKGILYAGLMIDGDDLKVLEFNARFGDPETQILLSLLDCKLGDLFISSIDGTLDKTKISFKDKHAITVVISSKGYPGSYEKGNKISGLDKLSDEVIAFHAGTKEENDDIFTNGGRVLNITAIGDSLEDARKKVYNSINDVKFDGAFYRKDIAHRAFK